MPVWRHASDVRFGTGRVVTATEWLSPTAYALLLLAQPGPYAVVWPLVANALFGLGMGLKGPLEMSYRNLVTPDRLRGRMNATIRSLNWGSIAVAAPLGGWVAATWGNRAAIAPGVAGLVVSASVLWRSPYRFVTVEGERPAGARSHSGALSACFHETRPRVCSSDRR